MDSAACVLGLELVAQGIFKEFYLVLRIQWDSEVLEDNPGHFNQ